MVANETPVARKASAPCRKVALPEEGRRGSQYLWRQEEIHGAGKDERRLERWGLHKKKQDTAAEAE